VAQFTVASATSSSILRLELINDKPWNHSRLPIATQKTAGSIWIVALFFYYRSIDVIASAGGNGVRHTF
jgi:hypothetical protein